MKSNLEFKVCLKSAKNLYLSHRFFYKIRQIHRFFDAFRQNLQILCRNQAPSRRPLGARRILAELAPSPSPATCREAPSTSSAFAQETRHPHEMDAGLKSLSTCTRRAPLTCGVARSCNRRRASTPAPRTRTLTCTRRSPYLRRRRSRPCQSSLSARQQCDPVRTQDP